MLHNVQKDKFLCMILAWTINNPILNLGAGVMLVFNAQQVDVVLTNPWV